MLCPPGPEDSIFESLNASSGASPRQIRGNVHATVQELANLCCGRQPYVGIKRAQTHIEESIEQRPKSFEVHVDNPSSQTLYYKHLIRHALQEDHPVSVRRRCCRLTGTLLLSQSPLGLH